MRYEIQTPIYGSRITLYMCRHDVVGLRLVLRHPFDQQFTILVLPALAAEALARKRQKATGACPPQ